MACLHLELPLGCQGAPFCRILHNALPTGVGFAHRFHGHTLWRGSVRMDLMKRFSPFGMDLSAFLSQGREFALNRFSATGDLNPRPGGPLAATPFFSLALFGAAPRGFV